MLANCLSASCSVQGRSQAFRSAPAHGQASTSSSSSGRQPSTSGRQPDGLRAQRRLRRRALVATTFEPPKVVGDVEAPAEQLDWRRQWYPVQPVRDLPLDRPTPIKILGKDLVAWRDSEGLWRVFEDSCPHRKVPLSEGRVEKDGTLSCAYHGWRFDGDGKCTKIPQINDSREDKACESDNSCAVSYPTVVDDGLLYVWLQAGPEARIEAYTSPLPLTKNYDEPATASAWYSREMKMSYEVLMENLTDRSHISFSHHGVLGARERPEFMRFTTNRRGSQGYTMMQTSWTPSSFGGMGKIGHDLGDMPHYSFNYYGTMAEDPDKGVGKALHEQKHPAVRMRVLCVPVTRTTSRLVLRIERFARNRRAKSPPAWVDHVFWNSEILDGDGIMLQRQTVDFAHGSIKPDDYFMPASCDDTVREFWRYMKHHAVQGINFYPHETEEEQVLPRHKVLDRYEQHTKHCSICRAALANVRRVLWVSSWLAVVSLIVGVAMVGMGHVMLSKPVYFCCGLALLSAMVREKMQQLERKFLFVDYVHADRH